MDRALTGGLSAGTTLAIALRLLDQVDHPLVPPAPCLLTFLDPPERSLDIASLLLGILIGFLVWPFLELLLHIRFLLQTAVLRRLTVDQGEPPARRPTYRLC